MILGEKKRKKKASPASHRYDRLPLLPSGPGGVQQELVVPDLRVQKYKKMRWCYTRTSN
jgi:hypothetical protein